MADLKLNGITPDGVGKIKVGNTNVQKIYNGDELVWPSSLGPGEVQVCSLIWKKSNSTTLAKVGGGSIDFATNADDWANAHTNQIPTACYFEFDSSKASYGLIYNYWAKSVIQPPTGFRLPSGDDISELIVCYGTNDNPLGADPGVWDTSLLTNTIGLGTSGFNAHGYGYADVGYTSSEPVSWINKGKVELYWGDNNYLNLTGIHVEFYTNGHLRQVTYSNSNKDMSTFIRFVKDE
jgi:uncharacterized protein (TIGR02145 family)